MRKNLIIGLLILAFLMQSIGIFTNTWTKSSENIIGKIEYTQGLWKSCGLATFGKSSKGSCQTYDKPPQIIVTIRILALIGIILTLVSFTFFTFYPPLMTIAVWCALIGGLISIIATIIWVTNKDTKPKNSDLGYSWYINFFGSLIPLLCGLVLIFFKKQLKL